MDAGETRYTPEKIYSRIEWLGTEIRPITKSEVAAITMSQLEEARQLSSNDYKVTRGVSELLAETSRNYGMLPGVSNQSALEIFKGLPKGNSWLDLGCGSGDFIVEVLKKINKKIKPVGFDARTWDKQKPFPELVLGDINNLNLSMFKNNPDGFDLITSAAVFYHLHDHLSVFKKATKLLKPNGKLLVSTINQPRYHGESILNKNGEFKMSPEAYSATYYRNRNFFAADGQLMSLRTVVDIVNRNSQNIVLEYSIGKSGQNISHAVDLFGGGFSAISTGNNHEMNISNIFYCYYPEDGSPTLARNDLSYIVAKTDSEAQKLKNQGYVSLE